MNVKIQGSGNGTYANTGSCVAVTNYLQHEDLERMKKGEEVQPFFNQFRDYVSARHRKSTRLNSSHHPESRMPSSA